MREQRFEGDGCRILQAALTSTANTKHSASWVCREKRCFPSLDVFLNKRTELSGCLLQKLLLNLAHYIRWKYCFRRLCPPQLSLSFMVGESKGFFVYRNGIQRLRSDWGPLMSDLQTNNPLISCKSCRLAVMKGGDEEDDGNGIGESCRKEIRLISGRNLGSKWECKCAVLTDWKQIKIESSY